MDSLSENPLMAEDYTRTEEKLETRDRRQMTIDVLPDNVFLEIFDFYIQETRRYYLDKGTEAWNTLVHVCRHWRTVVFESPLRLGLQILCTVKTPVREMLDIWPPLPIVIQAHGSISDVDNIVDSLKHNDRICRIAFYEVPDLLLEKIFAALMHESFPALTNLDLVSPPERDSVVPLVPFSGGSAPILQDVTLSGVPFPELSNFLSSSVNHLTSLALSNTPYSGYISPEAMVTCISALISLESFCLEYQLPPPHPDSESRRPRLPTRSVQPALFYFEFSGASEYLEDFVARIDVPQLGRLSITLLDGIISDTSQLVQFIYRLKPLDDARVLFSNDAVRFTFSSEIRNSVNLVVDLDITCIVSNSELPPMVQVCASLSHLLSSVESLHIKDCTSLSPDPDSQDDIENADQEWLDRLRPFTAVKDLYLCKTSARHIALELQELDEGRIIEVLPTLQNIFLDVFPPSGPVQEGIRRFTAARQLSSHLITVFRSDSEWLQSFH